MAFTDAEKFVNLGMAFPLAKQVGEAIGNGGYDAVTLTGDQTVAGVKTFSSSPVVPTATLADSSTKAATTAFVLTNAGKSKTQIAALATYTNTTGGTPATAIAAVPAATAAVTDTTAASLTSTNAAITALNNDLASLATAVIALTAALKA